MARHGGNSGKTGKSGKTVRTAGLSWWDKGVLAWEDWSEEGCAKNTPTFYNPLQRGLCLETVRSTVSDHFGDLHRLTKLLDVLYC